MKANLLGILKLICFILLVPFLVALVWSFYKTVVAVGEPKEQWLLYGVEAFVVVYLFVYNFQEIFTFGQTIVTKLLAFAKPIAEVAALIIPIYTLILSIAFLILHTTGVLGRYENPAILVLSFFWTMHVVVTAQHLHESEQATIKGGYFLSFGLAFIFHVIIAALLLAMVMSEFSLVTFVKHLSHQTVNVYHTIYKLLFVPS